MRLMSHVDELHRHLFVYIYMYVCLNIYILYYHFIINLKCIHKTVNYTRKHTSYKQVIFFAAICIEHFSNSA